MAKAKKVDGIAKVLLLASTNDAFLQALRSGPAAANEASEASREIIDCARRHNVKITEWTDIPDFAARFEKLAPEPLRDALEVYKTKATKRRRNHQTSKRKLVQSMGLQNSPPSLDDLRAAGIKIITRRVYQPPLVPRGTYVIENTLVGIAAVPNNAEPFILDATDPQWYIIDPNESVVVVDESGDILLVVLRNQITEKPGKMIQFGYNAGPRHRRFWGLVNNIKKKNLPQSERFQKDKDILGIMTLLWNIVKSHMLDSIVSDCEKVMDDAGMPRMGAKDNEHECGYTIRHNGEELTFPHVKRAPPEAYMTRNPVYKSHTDSTYAQWTLSLCTLGDFNAKNIIHAGGDFYDSGLGLVIRHAPLTLQATDAKRVHGTSCAHPGFLRLGASINFSNHIKKAFDAVKAIPQGEIVGMEKLTD